MHTLKWIKHSRFQFFVFLLTCSLSNFCFLLFRLTDSTLFFRIGDISVYLWILNGLPFITALIGLFHYMIDRKRPDEKALIGRKWLLLLAILICTPLVWLVSGGVMVALTGGV